MRGGALAVSAMGKDCFPWLVTIGTGVMRGFVFLLVWGTSLSCVTYIIVPMFDTTVALLASAFLLWTAVQCTRFYLLTCHTDPGSFPREVRTKYGCLPPSHWLRSSSGRPPMRSCALCNLCKVRSPGPKSRPVDRCAAQQTFLFRFVLAI